MKTFFIFSSCECVPKERVAVQGLIQKGNDEKSVFFKMVCCFCGKTAKIRQPIEDLGELLDSQKSLMAWLDTDASKPLLDAVVGDGLT